MNGSAAMNLWGGNIIPGTGCLFNPRLKKRKKAISPPVLFLFIIILPVPRTA
jgi:hypothetical protein